METSQELVEILRNPHRLCFIGMQTAVVWVKYSSNVQTRKSSKLDHDIIPLVAELLGLGGTKAKCPGSNPIKNTEFESMEIRSLSYVFRIIQFFCITEINFKNLLLS